jgi:hypothetical protein
MKILKYGGMTLLILLILAQFVRPARNKSGQAQRSIFFDSFKVNKPVQHLLETACFDCHSNDTRYPWYTNVQPVGWLMAKHIKDGKAKLNFDKMAGYGPRRIRSKFKAIKDQIEQDKMPLESYKKLHKEARLSEDQKALLLKWVNLFLET